MNSNKPNPSIENLSEEIQDIISRSPNGLVQWGTLSIFFVFLIFLIIGWLIKYPDVIKADVMITTVPSPVIMVSRSAGKILLNKKENDTVSEGGLIAYVQSGASVPDVLALDKSIELLSTSSNLVYRDSLLS